MYFTKMIAKRFRTRGKQSNRRPGAPLSLGRSTRMETLEDRRVLSTVHMMGDDFYVPNNGHSIQEAIDAAEANSGADRILVASDNYHEQLYIDDDYPLEIIGIGNVYLNGNNFDGNIVNINNSKHVTLKNLTIRNAEDDGIDAEYTDKITLYNVHSLNNDDDGLDAEHVDYVYAHNSKFNNNDDNGIELRNVGYAYLKDVQASYNGDDVGSGDSRNSGITFENGNNEPAAAAVATNGLVAIPGVFGVLEIFSGDFSRNERGGIYTDGVAEVKIDTIFANANGEDGVDVEDYNGQPDLVDINYAAFDANGEDGAELDAYNIELTETRAVHNYNEGVEIDDAHEVYIFNSMYSFNGQEGLELDNADWVYIDYVSVNYNGQNSEDTGLSVEHVDGLTVVNSEFLHNIGDGVYVDMNYEGQTWFDYVEASYNTGDGIDLRDGSADLLTVGTRHNDRNGVRAEGLKNLWINDSTATYNGFHGLKILGRNETPTAADPNGNGHGTDVYIVWSNFSHNYKDGIHAEFAGDIVLERMQASWNGDDGFDSLNAHSVTVIDSLFENNADEDFINAQVG